MSSKKNIIVVGGGGSGTQLARSLSQTLDSSKYSLILISSRNYFIHLPGTLRMLTTDHGKLEDKVLIPYDRLFVDGKGTFKQASVTAVQPASTGESGTGGGTVTLSTGEEIEFAAIVFATGSKWEGGINLPDEIGEAKGVVNRWRKQIEQAKGVAVVGGGAVGTEFAGEIRDIYPDKKITIVHKGSHLLNDTYPDKFRLDVEHRWTLRNIHVVLNDEIDVIPEFPVANIVTKGGVRVDGDLVIPTRGGRPNTSFLESLGPSVLGSSGRVKVDSTLQLKGFPGMFAMGDIIEWKEVKQVAKYGGHSKTIQANLTSYLEGKPLIANYKSMFEAIFLTNGAAGGAAYMDLLWGLCFGNWVTKTLKSADLFITPTLKGMGYS